MLKLRRYMMAQLCGLRLWGLWDTGGRVRVQVSFASMDTLFSAAAIEWKSSVIQIGRAVHVKQIALGSSLLVLI